MSDGSVAHPFRVFCAKGERPETFGVRAFPPMRRKKVAWMGHGSWFARSGVRVYDAFAQCFRPSTTACGGHPMSDGSVAHPFRVFCAKGERPETFGGRAFPPMRQRKVTWMGHGGWLFGACVLGEVVQ
jgi:hypothetical protein